MRALEMVGTGGLADLHVVDRPEPKPGAGEVLLRMKACSLNYRDLLMLGGRYGAGAKPPITPFSDGCGVVEAVGEGVTRVAVGDRVATMFFQNWISGPPTIEKISSALGTPIPGGGRELATFSQEGVSKVPDYLTDHEVSTLPCAALTAWRGLFEDASLDPGDVAVLQGTGGVSIFGLQFAHAAGFETVITSSSDAKLERAKALGADHAINYKTHPEWAKEAKAALKGRGADFVMEVGGPDTFKQSLQVIRIGGHVAIIGVLSGFEAPLSFGAMIGTGARVQGLSVGSRDMFEAMCRAMALKQIRPVVDKVYPWTQAREALSAMEAGEHFGKIVLDFTQG